jgi:hypothetical protein
MHAVQGRAIRAVMRRRLLADIAPLVTSPGHAIAGGRP